ncbi:MAG: 23S rRNA (adenine(2503)-C(2))-methyltransferase RlmN, partial [Bacillota bacterium]
MAVAKSVLPVEPAAQPGIPLGLVRTRAELGAVVGAAGEPGYRAEQVHRWVFSRGQADPQAMTSLPKPLRGRLSEVAWQRWLQPLKLEVDADGTRKGLLSVHDSARPPAEIEAVLIPGRSRLTLCLSTQAGCAVGCPFCATGLLGLRRNLSAPEIAGQVLWAQSSAGRFPTHVVFMGMGEPLANWEAVRHAIDLLRGPDGFGIGSRRLTVSTAGVAPGILQLAGEPGLQVNLALSLHAPNDRLRDRLVPLNRRWPLEPLMEAVRTYIRATRRRVSFEYVMLADVNDTPELARELADRVGGLLCHVNLIPYNPVPGLPFEPSPDAAVKRFAGILEGRGVAVTVRMPRGRSIHAACGQLGAAWRAAQR